MIKKTIVIAGQQGERGDKAEEYSVPIDGVLGYTETGTPDGYVEAGYFKVTGLDEVDSRIDVIESLPEGSTSGDAEVADIRVGVDGEIYDSAGIAVRDQITELHDYAESIDDVQDAQIDTLKVTKAVEGEYITLNDAAALPANEYALTLSPVQEGSGDPSPSNVRPIHGADEVGVRVCGKNLLEVTASTTTINGVTFTVNADGTVKVTGTATGTAVFQLLGGYNPDSYTELTNFGLNYNTNYSLNGCPSGGSNSTYRFILRSGGSAGNKVDTGNGVDFNIASDDTTLKWMPCIVISSGYAVPSGGLLFKPMIRYATVTDSTFEPYTLHSTTITLPSTVYGGSVEQGGSGSKTYQYIEFDGSNDENWIKYGSGSAGSYAMYIQLSDRVKNPLSENPPILANYLKTISQSATWGNYDSFISIYIGSDVHRIITGVKSITTVEDWRAYLAQNPLQVCFELATPTDITVTPFPQTLLEGVNNVWAECSEDGAVIGDAEQDLTYQRDTTLVIQNLINRIVELERRN